MSELPALAELADEIDRLGRNVILHVQRVQDDLKLAGIRRHTKQWVVERVLSLPVDNLPDVADRDARLIALFAAFVGVTTPERFWAAAEESQSDQKVSATLSQFVINIFEPQGFQERIATELRSLATPLLAETNASDDTILRLQQLCVIARNTADLEDGPLANTLNRLADHADRSIAAYRHAREETEHLQAALAALPKTNETEPGATT
ncbi:hypothetical protein BTO20_37950 (plasmid) [Mycobacterium dioxanotrophicus]|jgi:hypothetical protein|uniref:Uncharacterized protein n=1 Tax=Mycobacterium dioxanotrophicus TaxID=482462 RepID=A0A1Y0CH80_9MYCO|nr:hypothetical protein [Mycobacterium dioxanotrophicus]ART74404.1 hypothetical protein BTO20_37950 [Mycobacterium dioxanotrophicus]